MSTTPLRILVVDDSLFMRAAIKKLLDERPEFDVIALAKDGKDAIEKVIALKPDVVTMDFNMPNMNGFELLKLIRTDQNEEVRNLPVVVVTGAENDDQAKEEAYSQGATDFITKPFNTMELRARAQAPCPG